MKRYFVVEPEQVVADDLADAIRAVEPGAAVETFRTTGEVWSALLLARPAAVILSVDPHRFPDTPLGRELVAEGIPHGFLCAWGSDWPEGAVLLASPFSEATVGTLLRALAGSGE